MAVIGLRARCDYLTREDYRARLVAIGFPAEGLERELADFDRRASCTVTEVAVVDGVLEVPWRDDRGFSLSVMGFGVEDLDPWSTLSAARLEDAVRVRVADEPEYAPSWRAELARRLREHGVDVLPEQLAEVPIEVVLSDRLRERLSHAAG